MMSRHAATRPAAALVFVLLFSLLPPLAAQGLRASFEPVPVWTLEVGGRSVADARVYYSRAAGAFLVVADSLPSPLLLSARNRTVSPVQSLKLEPNDSGGYELLPDAVQSASGSFQLDGGVVRFQVGGAAAALRQRAWLTGWLSREQLLAQNAQYRQDARSYAPREEALRRLQAVDGEVELVVYFGEWCPHCSEVMPVLLAIEEQLADSAIRFRHYGLPTAMSTDPVVQRLDIQGVPTGIVYPGGREIGRIYGREWNDPAGALLDILTAS